MARASKPVKTINQNDKRATTQLIRDHFRSLRGDIRQDFTTEQISKKSEELVKFYGLGSKISRYHKLRQAAQELREEIAEVTRKVLAKAEAKNKADSYYDRGGDCECDNKFERHLHEASGYYLAQEAEQDKRVEQVNLAERKMLAKLEIAVTTDDLSAILKQSGLL